ncbi:redoxin family protein [Chelativorans sp. ZYF759]|uniref:TlpA disulfide reductase family protein n=1 Tax=Chelativorans sp. ZYF759 TaxID=2692213 RepID=UPI00145FB5ED|nr:TlpA disulfide reductase family protein [Chelativorans sp. ZYF759]NMG37803.1 redoxin family protein [Chelativorans sp. ZYF759]
MNAINIGPLMLSTDRVSALIGIAVFLAVTAIIARRMGEPLGRWSTHAFLAGVVAARLGHVAINWETFAPEPWRIVAIWQGGFHWQTGVIVAIMLLFFLVRPAGQRVAGIASLAAGLFVWHSATLLTSGVEPIELPQHPLHTLAHEPVQLAALGGQPMVVNLWATWCPPCRREMPMMADVAAATSDVTFVFANQGEDAPRIRSYLGGEQLFLPNVLMDGLGELGRHYGARGLPATLFIDTEGTLVDMHLGEISREAFVEKIGALENTER